LLEQIATEIEKPRERVTRREETPGSLPAQIGYGRLPADR